jgi:membrane associated rhomboid family serine protease
MDGPELRTRKRWQRNRGVWLLVAIICFAHLTTLCHAFITLPGRPVQVRSVYTVWGKSPTEHWEGDDRRWSVRIRRKARRLVGKDWQAQPARNALVAANAAMFAYQVYTTVDLIRRRHPSYWPEQAVSIVFDATWGSSILGPLTKGFAHSVALSRQQPYRYLTAGFLHGGILHLILNMDALLRLPSWLESGLGRGLYLTTFLLSVMAGNFGHTLMNLESAEHMLCLGASGGICGLYGLMYTSLVKMGNMRAASRVARGMIFILVYGLLNASISNASHAGDFLGGVIVGVLCGPFYRKSYAARRKNSVDVDIYPRDYRLAMGFGTNPSRRGFVPIEAIWAGGLATLIAFTRFYRVAKLVR